MFILTCNNIFDFKYWLFFLTLINSLISSNSLYTRTHRVLSTYTLQSSIYFNYIFHLLLLSLSCSWNHFFGSVLYFSMILFILPLQTPTGLLTIVSFSSDSRSPTLSFFTLVRSFLLFTLPCSLRQFLVFVSLNTVF